jgi:hypothetical protein
MVVAYYLESEVTQVVNCENQNFGRPIFWAEDALFGLEDKSGVLPGNVNGNQGSSSGIGGSFSRFTLYDNYLYTVDDYKLNAFLIEQDQLDLKNVNQLNWGIETIFPYKDKLFIGSNSGMYIFDNSNPESPVLLSSFDHARACDPVVVKDEVAYVTLRNGSICQGYTNQLDVIDISTLTNPKLIKSYPMDNPHGLAVTNEDIVYLCEGEYGLKTLDVTDPNDVKQIGYDKSVKTYDVIALEDKRLLMIGADGFYQYDATNPKNLKLLSVIPVVK